MMYGIQTLRNGGTARDNWRGGSSQRHQQIIKDRNKAIQGLSGRDRGIATQYALSRKDKEKSLQQSVGSLDRRINKAMEAGNLDQAKDLRSRQNVFSKRLANQNNADFFTFNSISTLNYELIIFKRAGLVLEVSIELFFDFVLSHLLGSLHH